MKNNLLCDDRQYVYYLSPTEAGSIHDKKIANEYPLNLPKNSTLKEDLGFVGHEVADTNIERPIKKLRTSELTFGQKIYNKLFSSTRVVIEHANSGVKRLRMVKDTIRIHSTKFRDNVIVVACALHNFRVRNDSELRHYKNSCALT